MAKDEMRIEIIPADPDPNLKLNWKVWESERGTPIRDLGGNEITEREALREGIEVLVTGLLGETNKGTVCALDDGFAVDSGPNLWILEYSDDERDRGWGAIAGINKRAIRILREREEKGQ